jgi:hypothetical protein
MLKRTVSPRASVRPIQAFSTKPLPPLAVSTTFGRKRRTLTRPGGSGSRSRWSVAVIRSWTTAESKNVRSGRSTSVTVLRSSRPSRSGQYSSTLGVHGWATEDSPTSRWPRPAAAKVTSRLSARERILLRSLCALVTTIPSGQIMRTGDTFAPERGTSTNVARTANGCVHFRGFFGARDLPVRAVHERVRAIPQSPALGNLGRVQFLSQHGLHRIAPGKRPNQEPRALRVT